MKEHLGQVASVDNMVLHRYDQLRKIYLAPPPQNELIFLIINHEKSKQVYCEKKSPFRGFLEKICFEKNLFYFIFILFFSKNFVNLQSSNHEDISFKISGYKLSLMVEAKL